MVRKKNGVVDQQHPVIEVRLEKMKEIESGERGR